MNEAPILILSTVGPNLLYSFISIFLFHVIIAVAISRVFSHISIGVLLFVFASTFRITERKKKFIRYFKKMNDAEKYIFFFLQGICFIFIFSSLYLDLSWNRISKISLFYLFLYFIGVVLRINYLALSPKIFFRRIQENNRQNFKNELLTSSTFSVVGLLILLSFYSGIKRFDYLQGLSKNYYSDGSYSGELNILISSENSTLAIEKFQEFKRYIYFSPRNIIVFHSGEKNNNFKIIEKKI